MLKYSILSDCITLLYRESLLEDRNASTSSADMIKNLLSLSKDDRKRATLGGETDYLEELTMLIEEMIDNPNTYDKVTLTEKLMLIHNGRMDMFKPLEEIINKDMSQQDIKRSISSLTHNIKEYAKKYETKLIINKAYRDFIIKDLDIKESQNAIRNLIASLETLSSGSKDNDPAIVDELDIENSTSIEKISEKAKNRNTDIGILKTGWGVLNRITQGGFRRGEMWMIDALQHNYKSGTLQTLLAQIARYNTPTAAPGKKPLLLYISFEDNSDIYIEFLYKYLYTNNNEGSIPDLKNTTPAEIANYLKVELRKNGYEIKTMRIDPSQWTYMDLFNKIREYEADGYEIHCCIIDYLAKLPTTGCINSGPGGTDVRDLFQKCRDFFSVKNICLITAHQLSVDAKQLIRNGIKEADFVKMIANKGYTELSKQLDQVVDGELYIHIATISKEKYLTIQRGKHRIPSLLKDEDKYGKIKFQPFIPLQDNLNDTDGGSDEEGNEMEGLDELMTFMS